jgi:hypothetical protein
VFYVAANGSRAVSGEATLVPYDRLAGSASDVLLEEMASLAKKSHNLVALLDAGCGYDALGEGFRSVPAEVMPIRAARDIGRSRAGTPRQSPGVLPMSRAIPPIPPVGAVTILAAVPGSLDLPGVQREARVRRAMRGLLTDRLISASKKIPLRFSTYEAWARTASAALSFPLSVLGPAAGEPVLRHRTRVAAVEVALGRLESAPAGIAVELIQRQAARFAERNESSPQVHIALGLSYAALARSNDAIQSLRRARSLYDDDAVRIQERNRDPSMAVWEREARYHLGRLLYKHRAGAEDLTEAVALLRQAYKTAPDDPRICLHLGLAIRALVERQSLVEAADLLRAYLAAGAPAGLADEVRRILAEPSALHGSSGG